jgi:K+-sensing histidine kinase KdpD
VRASPVDQDLALCGERDHLLSALASLLEHACTLTAAGSEVLLTAYSQGEGIIIDVRDRCGGLAAGVAASMFLPPAQAGLAFSHVREGLVHARQHVLANDGELSVHDLPLDGRIMSISLPRHAMPT